MKFVASDERLNYKTWTLVTLIKGIIKYEEGIYMTTLVFSNTSKCWWVHKFLVHIDRFSHTIGEYTQNYFPLAWNAFLFGMENVPMSLRFAHDSLCPLLWSSVLSFVEMAERQLLWLTSGTSLPPVHLPTHCRSATGGLRALTQRSIGYIRLWEISFTS